VGLKMLLFVTVFIWGKVPLSLVVVFFIFFLFFFFVVPVFLFIGSSSSILLEWDLLSVSGVCVRLRLVFDWVSLSFCAVVLTISFRVVWFSYYYMFGDQYVYRFTWLVVLFVMSIVFLIFIPNLVTLLIGWDGLGLISFCLVVYYQNFKSLVCGVLTVLINRVGDVIILLSIGWLVSFGSWDCFYLDSFFCSLLVSLCLVLAGITKSAQFPFSRWLPAAMAAPTPVSALVHSSTLVTAGVYLIIRFWPFISFYFEVVFFLQFIRVVTIFLSGFSALFETDMKKVIALSTLSQLRVILFAVSFGFSFLGLFHLYTHALFKALLFLCAGCLIHSFSNVQDLRNLGSCWSVSSFLIIFFNLANLALCGFPFLGGFFSKDAVLERFLFSEIRFLFFFFLFLATSFTVAYRVRLLIFSCIGISKFFSFFLKSKDDYSLLFPMFVLSSGAVFGGFFFFVLVFERECDFFFCRVFDKNLVFFVLVFGVFLGLFFYMNSFSFFSGSFFLVLINYFGGSMWFVQPVSTQGLLFFPMRFFFLRLYIVDRGYYELFGGQGIANVAGKFSNLLSFYSFKRFLFSCVFFFISIFFFFV